MLSAKHAAERFDACWHGGVATIEALREQGDALLREYLASGDCGCAPWAARPARAGPRQTWVWRPQPCKTGWAALQGAEGGFARRQPALMSRRRACGRPAPLAPRPSPAPRRCCALQGGGALPAEPQRAALPPRLCVAVSLVARTGTGPGAGQLTVRRNADRHQGAGEGRAAGRLRCAHGTALLEPGGPGCSALAG